MHPEDEVITVLDPEDEPDPSDVTSDVTMEELPELSEEVRRFREANDRTLDTYAAEFPELVDRCTERHWMSR